MPAEGWAIDAVANELALARDGGEMRSVSALQEACGVGHEDLMAVLDVMRERGSAVEAAPGEWRQPFEDEVAPPAAEDEPQAPEAPAGMSLAEAERAAAVAAPAFTRAAVGEATASLPRAMADVLDAAAIGSLVKAGIDSCPVGQTFVFEVTA